MILRVLCRDDTEGERELFGMASESFCVALENLLMQHLLMHIVK